MCRAVLVGFTLAITLASGSVAQVPPKYEIVAIDDDPLDNYTARMNNHGQIVYSVWFDDGNTDAIEIFLYDDGDTVRLTDDNTFDRVPDINDDGTIVWCRAVDGPGTPIQIVMWEDGELTQLTFSEQDDRSPRINNRGRVVWKRYMGDGCGGQRMDIFFYDGEAIQRITTNGETDNLANQSAKIDNRDRIVWTEYNFCDDPWTSRIMMWDDGVITQLSPPDQETPQAPNLNNRGLVTWKLDGIWLWEDGVVSQLTDWGGGAKPNDRGEIALSRSYPGDPVPSSEVWLYRNGEFYQITDNPHDQGWYNLWNGPTDINEKGEIVYLTGRPWFYEGYINLMRLRLGSANPPGRVDVIDVRPITP